MSGFPTKVTFQIMTIHQNLKPGMNFEFLIFFPWNIYRNMHWMPGRAQRKHYHILGDFILQETAV